MKEKIAVILLGVLCVAYPLQARKATVKVKTPGILPTLIAPGKKNKITELTLKGALNGTDLRFLREMAGSDLHQKATDGQLRKVDLSKATFALGGEAYIDKERLWYPTGAYTIPKFLFRYCRIEEVILPERTDTIGAGAFEYSCLKRIHLPEDAVVDGWAFNGAGELQEVVFPSHIREIGSDCFRGCKALKQLILQSAGYIADRCFVSMDSLESIQVKGILQYVEGAVINRCPRLRSVDFYGLVLLAGDSPLVFSCPLLQRVTFHDLVFFTNYSEGVNCPMLQDYTFEGMTFYSNCPEIPHISQVAFRENPRYWKLLEELDSLYSRHKIFILPDRILPSVLYNGARAYAMKGEKEKALKMLEQAVRKGRFSYIAHYTTDYESGYKELLQETEPDAIREDKRFIPFWERVREKWEYVELLRKSAPYERTDSTKWLRFTYAEPTDSDLMRVREYFNLDSIAGQGDELSRMKNLLYWLHDSIRHNGSSSWPTECCYNVIDLYKLAKQQNRGYNCRFMAMMLNEIYLAAGFKSRFITCMPYDDSEECHVINVVWSRTLQKWVWMDPTFAAYVTDENGLLLHPGEVRERLVKGLPLVLNEDANWNHKVIQTKEEYLEQYMAKNLYYFMAHLSSEYEMENRRCRPKSPSIMLSPKGPFHQWIQKRTHDDACFWQAPE